MTDFGDEYKEFLRTHKYKAVTAHGQEFKVIDAGSGSHTIVFLNGVDMDEAWIKYFSAFEPDFRVVLMKYPVAITKNIEMAEALHDLLVKLHIDSPILCGISDGGVLAQLYAKMYKAGGLILISTLTVDSDYARSMRKERYVLPLMKLYFRNLKFEKMRVRLVESVKRHFRNETEEEKAYAVTFLQCVGEDRNYRYRFLRAITATADICSLDKFEKDCFEYLRGKVLVLIPENDMFDKADSQNLVDIFTDPVVKQTYGGHLGMMMRPDLYIEEIRKFLEEKF